MKFLPTIFILALFLVPEWAYAMPLVPCDGVTVDGIGTECSACYFVEMGNRFVGWLIGMAFLFFAVLAVIAGFKLVTSGGNPEALSSAKQSFINAFIGLIIVMASFLLVDTVMRQLLSGGKGEVNGLFWAEVKCHKQAIPETGYDEMDTGSVGGVPTPSGDTTASAPAEADSIIMSKLSASGITVKSGAKITGVKPHVIDSVSNLNSACGCNIVITEGTGGTHSTGDFSHATGYKLDLRTNDNPALVDYVKSTYKPAGKWKDGTLLYYDSSTCGTYAVESDHIDVVYKSGC